MKLVRDESPYFMEIQDSSVQSVKDFLNSDIRGKWYMPYLSQGAEAYPIRPIGEAYAEPIKHAFHILTYEEKVARQILDLVPLSRPLQLSPFRVSIFMTPPGFSYRPHKDGRDLPCGLNYPLYIKDDGCQTNWFDDEVLDGLAIEQEARHVSREVLGFDKKLHEPSKSFVMNDQTAVLFNVDKWHAFTNASTHWRMILTLRPLLSSLKYEIAASRTRSYCT